FGADLNAYTSFDETVYMLQLPTDSAQVFSKGFQILEDWAHNVSFDNSEIDKERGVVIEEWRLGLGAGERLRNKYFPVILKGSRYATRNPIGTKENLDTFHYETIKKFYKDWYRPDLEAVIVVGDVDVAQVEKMIKDHFSSIPKRTQERPRTKYGVPSHTDTRVSILTDPEQQYNILQVYYLQPEIPEATTELQYRAGIVRELFNSMMNDRLQEIAQKPDAPFLQGFSSYGKFIGDKDALSLFAVAKNGASVAKSTEVLLTENERVRKFGFTQTELERAKKNLLSNMESAYNERDKTRSSELVGELIRNYLDNEPIPGIAFEYGLYQKYIDGIKLDEVNGLIKKWIKPTDRDVIVLGPEADKDKLISEKDMLALLNKPITNVTAYQDKVSNSPLLLQQPVAGTIKSEKKYDAIGTTVLTLSNGAKVILKPTNFKNDEITFSAISPGGASVSPEADNLSATFAAPVVNAGGLGDNDIQSLQKLLAGKQVNVNPGITRYSQGFTGSSTPKDFETAMQLLYGYFTEPRKDSVMFQVLQQQLTTSLANKGKDPNNVFSDSVQYIMSSYNPRNKPLTLDRLDELSLDKAYDIYKQRFSDAGSFIFTFVGNFSVDSIKPLIEKYIASLPATGKNQSWKDVGIRYPKGVINKVVKKGQENKSTVRLYFTGMTNYSDLEATQLDQTCKALEIKLREVLREDQGGVYGVGVHGVINREPVNSYSIVILFTCSTENMDKLVGLTMNEIRNLKQNGAAQVDVEKVVAEDVRGLETSVKENSYWKYNLEQKIYHNEDPTTILQDSDMVKKLTVERTKEIGNKYFDENNMAKLILAPENK
ncbi:MAG TPA: insulinase family protein, partial [Chitinophagaceae bacterium]|nr:insulinase family protein [Chitinophagaceae bacterium]